MGRSSDLINTTDYDNLFNGAPAQEEANQPLTVSAALNRAKISLEAVTVKILGEVSEVSVKPGYKAAYFTVKDSAASLPCMMWNNRYRASDVQLAVGQLVEITGRFTLYAAKGRMNFDVFSLALAGEGDLRMKVANIAKKLRAEGLTDPARKRSLPSLPERIGLVTSPRSAAVHDVLRTLRRRYPLAEVLLAGVPVEGAGAPAGLIDGIRCVVDAGAQVVLVVRGGGSFEDMMPFNDEGLARAIAACPVPVVTGIGHEVDTCIADMVSDFRASTPTAAAESVSPSRESLDSFFDSRSASLVSSVQRSIADRRAQVSRYSDRPIFRDPMTIFAAEGQMLDYSRTRLASGLQTALQRSSTQVDAQLSQLQSCGNRILDGYRNDVARHASRLSILSPLNTIARGYSVAKDPQGEIIRHTAQAAVGSGIVVHVSDGRLHCTVDSIDDEPLIAAEPNQS